MAEPRYRYSGRRSPQVNPARASMPVNIGYNPHYSGDLHTVQTARYDAAVPRRATDHKVTSNPTATITTYNVTKEPAAAAASASAAAVAAQRSSNSNTSRRRSSTVDTNPVKPIIVTTNHASRPHGASSHTSSAARTTSPSRDPYRSSDETYYTQPASSIRSRSQARYGHGYTQSATLSNEEFSRLRERVGDDRLRPPTHVATDYYRSSLPHANYTTPSFDLNSTAVVDYDNEGYEYTKPSDLARYDLDHDRQLPHRNRRESLDRSYHRPTVNVVSNDLGRYDTRGRGPPPSSSALERYNRTTAAGVYDRPTVTMPALPPVPAAPPVDPLRRIEAPRDPSPDRKTARPRPVSLYQDAPARMSHPEEIYRSKDDERLHRRQDRKDGYRDDDVPARGFGIRTNTNTLEPERADRPARSVDRRDYDDRRQRRDVAEREPRRRSDESIDYTRSHDSRKPTEDTVSRTNSVRDPKDSVSQKNGVGGRTRDKIAAGLGVAAAAAVGLVPRDTTKDDDRKVSPRRRDPDEDKDTGSSRTADKYKPREKDIERKASPREEPVAVDSRRESRKEQADSTSSSRERERERELERERVRERAYEREREREQSQREIEKEREREREREKEILQREREVEREAERELERNSRDDKTRVNGSAAVDSKDDSSIPEDSIPATRRRRRNSSTFDPTDTVDLLDVKAELAAKEDQDKTKEKPTAKEAVSDKETTRSASVERMSTGSREESRGRDNITAAEREKQVRVVSPPREKSDQKPIKGILKPPSAKFPEDQNPIREGVAPHKDDKTKKGVPPGARWTKINRKLINPAALENGKERFEVRDDFVIVLRVLTKEDIQKYANDTAKIRAEKRREYEKQFGQERNYESHREDRDYSDDERRIHHSNPRDHKNDHDYRKYRDRDDDRDRPRRAHRHGSDSDDGDVRGRRAIEYDVSSNTSHETRPHRSSHRDYDAVSTKASDRR
ncbi:hypothetical protein F5Y00DRAFT_112599 [Daldinia vernicosa]|uniref:uncharacterized protein n=1 Tax=Daldinia vernicosa TaxID=114800 RepID=UPI0020073F44|nr:uncharacterized protein F5Y00DRAFT_112599 [Daldinia vernicosa]KAI0847608.1 hypothetical protein F5Y00DRAFT_112599 [Daldinia vernicosa]